MTDFVAYGEKLQSFVYASGTTMKPIFSVAKRAKAKRIAYAEGFTMAAKLFARIDELQNELGDALEQVQTLQDQVCDLESRLSDALEALED